MKLHEALATGLPFRRSVWAWDVYILPETGFFFGGDDRAAADWEVKQRDVTITRSHLIDAYARATREAGLPPSDVYYNLISAIAKQLGLGDDK